MTQPTGSTRPLQFPLNRSADIVSETPPDVIGIIDLVEWSTTDSNERVDIVLNLSLDEYVALATSIDVGRDIAYGDNSIYIWWIWVRSLKSMNLCASVLECVETDLELQRAISGLSTGSNLLPNSGRNGSIENELVLQGNANCDNDNLFGAMTGIVDLYNNLAEDLIEQLVSSVNSIGRMGDMIEAIPVIGELPFDDILQFTESFVDDLQQNYLASYTVALRDKYRCDLFCLARGNCGLTFTDIFNYYNDQMVSQMLAIDVEDVIEFLTQGSFSGEELVLAFNAFVASFFMFGSSFLGITDKKLISMVSAMFNDPDSDWLILCTECNEVFVITFDDLTSDNWNVTARLQSGTTAIDPLDLQSNLQGNPTPSCESAYVQSGATEGVSTIIKVEFTVVQDVNSLSFEYLYSQPINNVYLRQIQLFDVDDNLLETWSTSANDAPRGAWTIVDRNFSSVDVKYIEILTGVTSGSSSFNSTDVYGYVDNIRIN